MTHWNDVASVKKVIKKMALNKFSVKQALLIYRIIIFHGHDWFLISN